MTSNPSGYQSHQSEERNGRCTLIITPEAHGSGDFFLGALSGLRIKFATGRTCRCCHQLLSWLLAKSKF
ncbi:hypothetical protein, partial [Moorena sp. SIO3B2]|uniref:hypothetical protein n=1 Tax=Moorena sp. SIO3B2 TaxID=2607827 RepID=UPI00257BFF35